MVIVDFCTNKYRLDSLFGIQFFFMPFWGELSAAEFCYGIRFIVLVLGRIICGRILLRRLVYWFGFGFWGEGVGELLGYLGGGDSDDFCCGGGEAEEVDVAVPHN